MKLIIYILTLTLFLLCSSSSRAKKIVNLQSVNTLKPISVGQKQSGIYIKDKLKYDKTFIDGLSDYNESIRLIDNYIITGKDTTFFPDAIPLNKSIVFKGTKANNNYFLTVSRTNLTNLTYEFKLTDKDAKTLAVKSGKSILGSMFFLGSEMDEDSQTGKGYASYEYWDNANDCWFAIRIGNGKDENGKQRAKVEYGCKDKSKPSLKLDECPTLRTE